MSPTIRDKLVRNIVRLEDLIKKPQHENAIVLCYYDIIESLLRNDGYQAVFNPSTGPYDVDCYGDKQNSVGRIGVSFKRDDTKVETDHVLWVITTALAFGSNRVCIIGSGGFTPACYQLINEYDPARVELLDLTNIKNWVTRIEVESELAELGYEDIIKIVSKAYIEKIAANPDFLLNLEWRELEKTLAEIFEGLAFKVKLTPPSKDGGKDLILEIVKEGTKLSYIVEVKHWRSMQKVGQSNVKDFIRVVCNEKREKGIFLSTFGFTENAFEGLTELERTKVRFGNQEKIISLCKTYLRVRSGIWTPLNDLQELLYEQTI